MVRNLPANSGDASSIPGWEIPCRKAWQPTPVFLSGESHGQRSLEGYTVRRVTRSRTQLKQFSVLHINSKANNVLLK